MEDCGSCGGDFGGRCKKEIWRERGDRHALICLKHYIDLYFKWDQFQCMNTNLKPFNVYLLFLFQIKNLGCDFL